MNARKAMTMVKMTDLLSSAFMGSTGASSFFSISFGFDVAVGAGGFGMTSACPSLQHTMLRTMISPASPPANSLLMFGMRAVGSFLQCGAQDSPCSGQTLRSPVQASYREGL